MRRKWLLGNRWVVPSAFSHKFLQTSLANFKKENKNDKHCVALLKGSFIKIKKGAHLMRTRPRSFSYWTIKLGKLYHLPERSDRFFLILFTRRFESTENSRTFTVKNIFKNLFNLRNCIFRFLCSKWLKLKTCPQYLL